jgi:hypothetical protein
MDPLYISYGQGTKQVAAQSNRRLHATQIDGSDGSHLSGDAVWLLRQHAAAPRFNASVFCDECIMNILGWLCLPYMLWRHGRIGAVNRGFLTNIAQICFTLMFWYINGLAAWYWKHPSSEFSVSYWNVVVVDMLFVLRATIIATKYASYLPSEYRAVDTRLQSPQELGAKNLLVGWLSTGTALLAEEVERAIVRSCPDLTHFRMVFSNPDSRITALSAMQDCLPSYFLVHGYLLGKDAIVPATAAKVPEADKLGRHSLFAFILSKVHFLPTCYRSKSKIDVRPAERAEEMPYTPIDSPNVTEKQDSEMWRNICAHPLMACKQPDAVVTPSVVRRTVKSSSAISPHPADGKCCLPAKLFLWHILYTVYVKHNPSLAKFTGKMSVVAGLGFGCLPAITHIVLQNLDATTWQNVSMLVFSSVSCMFWMMLQHAYSNIGVVDQTRHLHTSEELLKLLDINDMAAQCIPRDVLTGNKAVGDVGVGVEVSAPVFQAEANTHETRDVSRRTSLIAFKRDVQLIDQRLKDFTPEEVAVIVKQRRESPVIVCRHYTITHAPATCVTPDLAYIHTYAECVASQQHFRVGLHSKCIVDIWGIIQSTRQYIHRCDITSRYTYTYIHTHIMLSVYTQGCVCLLISCFPCRL